MKLKETMQLNFIKKQGLLLSLIFICLFFSIFTSSFFSFNNFLLIIRQVSILGIISGAITFVLISGNLDLSVGAVVSFSATMAASLCDKIGPLPAILVALCIGLISGAICGVLIGHLKLSSLIVTLGIANFIQGLSLLITGGTVSVIHEPDKVWLVFFGQGNLFGIPFPVILLVVCMIIFQIILSKTLFGKQLMAVGHNARASKFAGINDKKIVWTVYLLSGLISAFAGIILAARNLNVQPGLAMGYEFDVLAGVILGGTSLLGGSGNVIKSFLGLVILGALNNGFIILGLPYFTQWLVQAAVLIIVVWADKISKRREELVR